MVDYERQLLSSWLNGYNTHHVKEFDSFIVYPKLFTAIKKAKKINPIEISRESHVQIAEVMQIITEYMPSMYDGAYRIAKEEKIKAILIDAINNPKKMSENLGFAIKEIENLQTQNIKEPTDLCKSYQKEIDKRKIDQPLKFGITELDFVTGGLRRQELTTVAARPSVGKTTFALQTAFKIALGGNRVLFFPLEMSASQLMERLVCRETQIAHQRLKTPSKMTKDDGYMLKDFYAQYDYALKKNLMVIEKVSYLSDIKKHIEHYAPKLVVIDQLSQLKEYKKFNTIREQFSYMTNTLKAMTMELDIPIILLAQINREGEGKEPTLRDLKESGSIEEDSDNIIMLYQPEQVVTSALPIDIIIRKQRNGARDKAVRVRHVPHKFSFEV